MSRSNACFSRSSSVRMLLVAVASILVALFAVSNANAAIGVSGFSVTTSTTQQGGNPNIAVVADRTGGNNDLIRQAALKLPAGSGYALSSVPKCSSSLFGIDRCPANSIVGAASMEAGVSLLGTLLNSGTAGGQIYAISNTQIGIAYRTGLFATQLVRMNISGTPASGLTLTSTDYRRTLSFLGLLPLELRINRLNFDFSGKPNGNTVITNPTTCGPATSTFTLTPWSGSPASQSSSFNVTGCGPTDTEGPVVDITSPTNGAVITTPTVPIVFSVSDNEDPAPDCNIVSGDAVVLTEGSNTITVTCTDASGNLGSDSVTVEYEPPVVPDTILGDVLPASPNVVNPTIPVSSDQGAATFECRINNSSSWLPCDPSVGSYDAGISFNPAETNKFEIRAVLGGTPDPTPTTNYMWLDDRSPAVSATLTSTDHRAGAHPDISTSATLDGGYNPSNMTIELPLGFNGAITAVGETCAIADAYAGECGTNAPGSQIGTLTGEGVSTSHGYLDNVTGDLYMTESPDGSSPAGVALEAEAPFGLGSIRAVGAVRIVQNDSGEINGEIRQVIQVDFIPQRTDLGNRFHANKVTVDLDGDPAGGTYPLLTNPSTCPETPQSFRGFGGTYDESGDDNVDTGPPIPDVLVDYEVTDCESLEFDPQVAQEFFMPDPINGSTYNPADPADDVVSVGTDLVSHRDGYRLGRMGAVATLDMGGFSTTARRGTPRTVEAYMPTSVGANLPAFGDVPDMCPGNAATYSGLFDPSGCPEISKLGTIEIQSPLVSDPLIGNVYAINKQPLPWLGIHISSDISPQNPVGVDIKFVGVTNVDEYPGCDPTAAPWCGQRVQVSLRNLPDVPMNNVVLDMSGRTARPTNDVGAGEYRLSTLLLKTADGGDEGCRPSDQIVTEITPSHSSAVTTLSQDTSMGYCVPPAISAITRTFVNPVTGATSTNPALTAATGVTASWTAEPGSVVTCSVNSTAAASYVPCASPYTIPGLVNGSNTLRVKVETPDGLDGQIKTVSWNVDAIAPGGFLTFSRTSADSAGTATFAWTRHVADATSAVTVVCRRDSETWGSGIAFCGTTFGATSTSGTASWPSPPAGVREFAMRMVDSVGNIGPVSSDTWTNTLDIPDTEGPVVTITSPDEGDVITTPTVPVVFSVLDNEDPAPTCNVASGAPYALVEGSNTIVVTCTDAAGNPGSDSVTVSYDAPDSQGPVVTISSPQEGDVITTPTVPVVFSVLDDEDPAPDCNIDSGDPYALSEGTNTIVVTCTDAAGNPGSDDVTVTYEPPLPVGTVLGDVLPASPNVTNPTIPVSSGFATATFECLVNDVLPWLPCDPSNGVYDAGISFTPAATNKIQIRAVYAGNADPTPTTNYMWLDDRSPLANATVTSSDHRAGAHPDISTTVTLDGGHNPSNLTIELPLGFNGALTAVSETCSIGDAYTGACGVNAPGSKIGTLTGEGVSTSHGYLDNVTGDLYMTETPDGLSPAGVALDLESPFGLGPIRAVGAVRIVQNDSGEINGEIRQVIQVDYIPQRTELGNRFHVNEVTVDLDGDPAGGTYPLLTNPSTCPETPQSFRGFGGTYDESGDDNIDTGPPVPDVFVDYEVTDCDTLEFNPQLAQDFFMPDPITGSTYDPADPGASVASVGTDLQSHRDGYRLGRMGTVATLDMGGFSTTARRGTPRSVEAYMPSSVGANLPAFGDTPDMCPGNAATTNGLFDPSGCPAISLIGTIEIESPLVNDPLIGNVYAINKQPLPWLGIHISSDVSPQNPAGIDIRFVGLTNVTEYPGCNPTSAPWCGSRVQVSLRNLPDIPMDHVTLDMSGRTARPTNDVGAGEYRLSTLLLKTADGGDEGCRPTDQIISEVTPAHDNAVTTLSQDTTMAFCDPPVISDLTRTFTNPTTGAVSINPSTTAASGVTASWTAEPGNVVTCSVNSTATASYGPCASPYSVPGLVHGTNTLRVKIERPDGLDGQIKTATWNVDAIAPGPFLTFGMSSPLGASNVTFPWTRSAADATSATTIQCRRDGGAWGSGTSFCGATFAATATSGTATWLSPPQGNRVFSMRMIDAVGNQNPVVSANWTQP